MQFAVKQKSANSVISDSDDIDVEEPEDEETTELDLEVDEEVDMAQQASDDQKIQELANEVDLDICFFVGASDLELGRSAMTKVHRWLTGVYPKLTSFHV